MPSKKKKNSDKIVIAEMNNLLWQLFESTHEKSSYEFTAKILTCCGLLHNTPKAHKDWINKAFNRS